MTRFEEGYRTAIEDCAAFLEQADKDGRAAQGHWINAGALLRKGIEKGFLKLNDPHKRPRAER